MDFIYFFPIAIYFIGFCSILAIIEVTNDPKYFSILFTWPIPLAVILVKYCIWGTIKGTWEFTKSAILNKCF